jgi:hypothetical protein
MGKKLVVLAATLWFATGTAFAQTDCGLCARTVVINSALAGCFLHRFPEWQFKASAAIVVDLSSCKDDETGRGVIAALPAPGAPSAEPDKEFIVTLAQLVCLKRKLEDPALVLDPSATIDLGACE